MAETSPRMSQTSEARSSVPTTATPMSLLETELREMSSARKRRAIKPTWADPETGSAMMIANPPEWPGSGMINTVADAIPTVVIPGMPTANYPGLVGPLTAYALAELATRHPSLMARFTSETWVRAAILTVATRAGIWAALGVTPDVPETVATAVVRWSARLGTIVVRPMEDGDGSGVWRYFLASCLVIRPAHLDVVAPLVGLAPLQFLLGGALHVQAGEVYAMQLVEAAVSAEIRAVLSPSAVKYLALEDRATWDTLNAAAVGGFRASVIKALCVDKLFVPGAYMRLEQTGHPSMAAKYADALLAGGSASSGIKTHEGSASVFRRFAAMAPTHFEATDDDTASVADTEVMGPATPPALSSGFTTPRGSPGQPMTHAQAEAIRESVRAIPAPAVAPASLLGGATGDEEVVF